MTLQVIAKRICEQKLESSLIKYLLEQESCAIAKTTARCTLYIAALKILESP